MTLVCCFGQSFAVSPVDQYSLEEAVGGKNVEKVNMATTDKNRQKDVVMDAMNETK